MKTNLVVKGKKNNNNPIKVIPKNYYNSLKSYFIFQNVKGIEEMQSGALR